MSARPPLEAVVFDAGGTLVRLDFEWMCETVTALGFPLAAPALRRGEVDGRRAFDRSYGEPPSPGQPSPPLGARGDVRAYFGGMLTACGAPPAVIDRALDAFSARHRDQGLWTRPVEGAREALDALGALGLRRAVVSNSDGRAERHLVDCGVREGLEFVVDSQRVGVEKPDPAIFAIALDRLGVRAERSLYVGDILCVDFEGSRAAGMPFALLDPYGDYATDGVVSLPGMHRLAEHVTQRFACVAAANAAVAPAHNRAVP